MEPGVPNPAGEGRSARHVDLDSEVRFWATPPIHGCLRRSVVHPAAFTYRLPEGVSLEAGAFVEPLAVGLSCSDEGIDQTW